MRLDWLRIPHERNLRDFEIDFDEGQPTTVLLGRNGSGKSNLIENIVRIFRDLELGSPPSFAYQMRYVCRDHKIEIDADPERPTKRLDIKVDGAAVTQTAFQENLDRYLPTYCVRLLLGVEQPIGTAFRPDHAPLLRPYSEKPGSPDALAPALLLPQGI